MVPSSPARWLAFVLLAGCGGAVSPATSDLAQQVRQLRAEQERQARQLELLEHRVVLAEDSARLARQALTGVGARSTVRIDPEHPGVEPIPSPAVDGSGGDDGAANAQEPEPPGGRPVVRAAGRAPLPDAPPPGSAAPPVRPGGERLPVAPVPVELAPSGRENTPPSRRHRRGPSDERGAPSGLYIQPADDPAPDAATNTPAASEPAEPALAGPALTSGAVSSVRDPRAAPAYEQALALARGGRCPAAIDALSEFLVRWPDHPFASNAMYWRGECILAGGDVRRAASEFEGLLARFPVGGKTPDALFKLAQCYARLGDAARAREFRARLLRDYPRSDAAARLAAERTSSP